MTFRSTARSAIERALGHSRARGDVSASYEEVERAEQKFYLDYLREGMTVFDVGANVGELSLLFSRFIGSGVVHAFEASATAYGALLTVLSAARRSNVRANHLAISDVPGVVRLHCYDGPYQSWNSMALRPLENYGIDVKPVGHEDVVATTVDAYCTSNGIARIDLLKIDVEGAELQVLKGAVEMMRAKRIQCISFEYGQSTFDMGNSPHDIEALFRDVRYDIRTVVEGDPLFPGREDVRSARFAMHIATPQ